MWQSIWWPQTGCDDAPIQREDTERQTREATPAQLQDLRADCAGKEPHAPWAADQGAPVGETFTKIQVREKTNATYTARIAFPFDQRHLDFPSLLAGVELMSRLGLWQRLREQDGISYGVGATLDAPWYGNASTRLPSTCAKAEPWMPTKRLMRNTSSSKRWRQGRFEGQLVRYGA